MAIDHSVYLPMGGSSEAQTLLLSMLLRLCQVGHGGQELATGRHG
jgi:hypothetical protein